MNGVRRVSGYCVEQFVVIGHGAEVMKQAKIGKGAVLGAESTIREGAVIGKGAVVGKGATIAPGAVVKGGAVIKDGAVIKVSPITKVAAGKVAPASGPLVVAPAAAPAKVSTAKATTVSLWKGKVWSLGLGVGGWAAVGLGLFGLSAAYGYYRQRQMKQMRQNAD